MVVPVIRYGAAVWGHKEYSCNGAVHNHMGRHFLSFNKFTPNVAVQVDMGVRVPRQHQNVEIARQWCRLANMSIESTNKHIYSWQVILIVKIGCNA